MHLLEWVYFYLDLIVTLYPLWSYHFVFVFRYSCIVWWWYWCYFLPWSELDPWAKYCWRSWFFRWDIPTLVVRFLQIINKMIGCSQLMLNNLDGWVVCALFGSFLNVVPLGSLEFRGHNIYGDRIKALLVTFCCNPY